MNLEIRSTIIMLVMLMFATPRLRAQVFKLPTCRPGSEYQTLLKEDYSKKSDEVFAKTLDTVKQVAKDRKLPMLVVTAEICRAFELDVADLPKTKKPNRLNTLWPKVKAVDVNEMRGLFHFQMSRFYFTCNDFPNAFHYIIQARNIFEQHGYEHLWLGSLYTDYFFGYYLQFEDYPTAIWFAEKSVQISDTFPTNLAFKLNNLGVVLLKMKQYDKAAATFKRVVEVAPRYQQVFVAIGSANYGNTLRLQGHYAEAIPYFYVELNNPPAEAPEDCAITCLYLADCLLRLDSTQKAKQFIDRSRLYDPGIFNNNYWTHYYEVISLYYLKTKQYAKATDTQQKLSNIKDSLRNVYDTRIVMIKALQAKEEKLLLQQQRSEQKAAELRYNRNLAIILLSTGFLLILLFSYQKKKKEQRLLREKQERAEQQLQLAQGKLQQYLSYVKDKNNLIEKIERDFSTLQTIMEKQQAQPYLEQLQQSVILTDEDWAKFRQLCEQAWPGMFAEMHEKYPGLNHSEERLLALSKLNISTKQMAGMIGISQDSLRKSRYRLRKKYPLLSETTGFGADDE